MSEIVDSPKPELSPEEHARRLRIEVERLARLPRVEWMYYVESDGYAEKYGITKATLKQMIEAVIKENEKKAREDRGELRRREKREEKQKSTAKRESERKEHEAKKEAERKEREARKEAERKDKEKQKAFAAIVKLPSSEHEGKLKTLARQIGEDVDVLREEFAELRSEEEEKIKRGEVEPWDEPVDTRKLLDEVTTQFGKYIIVHDRVIAPIIPLWICFAWVHDIATYSPILIFESADTGEAKTEASKMVALLTPRAYIIVEPTGPAFYRFVDRVHPTLVIDDADRLLPRRPDLAHIVNAGWTRSAAKIPRVDMKTSDVQLFDVFCPKVLNGINLMAHLAPATRTRCIAIKLLPKLEDEEVADHRHANRDENFVILRRKLLRWAMDNMAALDNADPKMPEGFFSRLQENYHLLFAAADLAGGDWPKKTRAAAVKLSREHNEPSLGKRLLAIFFDLSIKRGKLLTSKQLEQWVPAESDEFANYQNGRPINKYQIRNLLKPYGVGPQNIHPRGRAADRGYDTSWPEFTRAFRHWLGKTLPAGRTVVRKRKRRKK
jgi:Protein of unknown function (DUF3631)